MVKKAPRRTAQRILETALDLFNRFGEPNVSATRVANALRISPGNLYYHYPAKEALVNRLYESYAAELSALLQTGGGVRDMEEAWFFLHRLFGLSWRYRFLYRDLNDLLSRNRHLETQFQQILAAKTQVMRTLILALRGAGPPRIDARELDILARSAVVLLSHWLDYEYVLAPRQALDPDHVQGALRRGARHTLQLLAPGLAPGQRAHLPTLGGASATRRRAEPSPAEES